MDIRTLKYFLCIADCNGITAAAQKLNMTQPPLTNQLKSLESELGFPLFYRRNKKFYLTEKGRFLYQRASALTDDYDSLVADLNDLKKGITGRLNIGTCTSAGILLVPRLVQSFLCSNPGISIHLCEEDSITLIEMLADDRLDVAIVKSVSERPDMAYIYLNNIKGFENNGEMYIVGRKGLLHADSEETLSEDIANIPILIHGIQKEPFLDFCSARNIHPHIMGTNVNIMTSISWCADGLGIAIMSGQSIAIAEKFGINKMLICRPLHDYRGITVREAVCYKASDVRDPLIKKFISEFYRLYENK